MAGLRIVRGIPTEMADQAARLLVDAFALKFEHEVRARTPEQARRLMAAGMAPGLGLVALDARREVVSVLGIVVRGRRFFDPGLSALLPEFGVLGAVPRWASSTAEHIVTRPRKRQWRIQMLAVGGAVRGEGIGTALLTTAIDAARQAGMETVGLEVVDANERALRLYRRIGFRRTFTLPTGRLTAQSGFRGVCFMRLDCRARLPERPSRDPRILGGAGGTSH
jgi:ribosomal protein S18 acetylase RimI-like enzyme